MICNPSAMKRKKHFFASHSLVSSLSCVTMALKKSNKSVAEQLFLLLLQFEVETGAPNENIVQNHLNIALLNVL